MNRIKLFGEYFKSRRLAIKKTLRQFCVENGLDPGNISKLERGLLPPPQKRGKLEEYVKSLKIKKGSDDYYTFFDLAASCSGKIPSDVMSDEQLVKKLPLVFRTLRGKKVSRDGLGDLIELIRRT